MREPIKHRRLGGRLRCHGSGQDQLDARAQNVIAAAHDVIGELDKYYFLDFRWRAA